jgi:formyl-CoA transferase
MMPGPIDGLRVIDASQGLAGPFCAMRLGDAGADVIKVEPPQGDAAREMGPPFVGEQSTVFLSLNRNKRGLALDLDSPAGREVFADLCAAADVVIEDWGPGQADANNIGYAALSQRKSTLVWCAITPFGEDGPNRDLPGSELVVQAMSDYMNSLGSIGDPPVRVGSDIANLNTGIFATQAITAALFNAARTGKGQRVAVSLLGSLTHMRGLMWTCMSHPDEWYGLFNDHFTRPPDHGYQTKTGPLFWGLRRGDSEDWDRLLIELDLLDRMDDPRFAGYGREATSIGRYAPEVKPIWEEAFAKKDLGREEIIDLILSIKGDAVPLCDYKTLVAQPHVIERHLIAKVDCEQIGAYHDVAPVWTLSETPPSIRRPAPLFAEHTGEVLTEHGYSVAQIDQLRRAGTIT